MRSPRPASTRLPVEIVDYIFRLAAPVSLRVAYTLTRVSHWPRRIAMPYVWQTLIIRGLKETRRSGLGCGLEVQSGRAACKLLPGDSPPVIVPPFQETVRLQIPDMAKVWDLPHGATQYLHSMFVLPKPGERFIEFDSLTWFTISALPQLRRLAASLRDLRDILLLRRQRINPFPISQFKIKDQEVYVPELFITTDVSAFDLHELLHRDGLGDHICIHTLTHLRLGKLNGFFEGQSRIDILFPALTHFAYEDSFADIDIFPDELIEEFLENDQLQVFLILLRYEDCDDGDDYPERARVGKEMLKNYFSQTPDRRLLVGSITGRPEDDWQLWEEMAWENRNIWDEALAKRDAEMAARQARAVAAAAAVAASSQEDSDRDKDAHVPWPNRVE